MLVKLGRFKSQMEKKTFVSIGGVNLSDHTFTVPLDWNHPEKNEKIGIFARKAWCETSQENKYLVYLQGGPGFASPRPQSLSGWIKQAVTLGFTVLLLDQRGTGRSHSITSQILASLSPEEQARILINFRAPSIVKDCEFIRQSLNIPKWTLLGQSFGGFISTTYLSFAPSGLESVFMTGGLPAITATPDQVYQTCFKKCIEKNQLYFQRYPEDVELVKKIMSYLNKNKVVLPCGGTLSPRRFQTLGFSLGMSDGMENIHYLIEDAFVKTGFLENSEETLSYAFLRRFSDAGSGFETNPFYAILHEAIYCENGKASNWSAERVLKENEEYRNKFDPMNESQILFTGEMVFPFFFEDYSYLRPLKEAAEILSKKNDWDPLYDVKQLSENTVPVAAAVYENDMYVGKDLSLETASLIKGAKTWVTSEYEHNGLRAAGEKIFLRLYEILYPTETQNNVIEPSSESIK